MTNEIIIEKMEKANKKLMKRKEQQIYPISASLRKELRELKAQVVGNLNIQLKIIKDQKTKEFLEHNKGMCDKEIKNINKKVKEINNDWILMLKRIQKDLKKFYEKKDKLYNLNDTILKDSIGYCAKHISGLYDIRKIKKDYLYEVHLKKNYDEKMLKKLFDENYSKGFQIVYDKISILENSFEEAIVLGDLEEVKELYFILKQADKFLEKIGNIDVTKPIKEVKVK